jgi:hypothetical protein
MIRPTYYLIDIKANITILHIVGYIIFILIHVLLISIALYTLYSMATKQSNTLQKISIYLQQIVNKLLWQPLTYIRDLIAPHIPYSGILFCKFSNFLDKNDFKVLPGFVIFFTVLPRIIVSFIFFIEIVFFERIHYFIPGLILPRLWDIFITFFIDFAYRGLT